MPFVRETETNYPKSWAGIVAAAKSPNDTASKNAGNDGSVPVSVASLTLVSQAPRAQVAATRIPVEAPASVPAVHQAQQIPVDFASIMAAAIEAGLTPMKERLEATITPMQRTIENLQAEFVALQSEDKEGGMDCAAAGAKRLRTYADM